ncbi:MAG TPA: hypothetical protein VFJ02_17090 [Vicinamibacterales bacterium]|nr:hypothetical protein [Vicinamibacterales bacterium]
MRQTMVVAVLTLAGALPAAAQEQGTIERATLEAKLQLEHARTAVESRITRGAPYSAEAITETVQMLADGNRIARKSVTRIYRDSEGRIRRETVSPSGEVLTVNISDPVGESQYVLDPRTKTAHRNGVIMATPGGSAGATVAAGGFGTVVATRTPDGYARVEAREDEIKRKIEAESVAAAAAGGGRGGAASIAYPPEATMTMRVPSSANINKEDLGSQIIDGVMAKGTRSTTTIEAGAIGNAQPIHIVSEQWYSEDLKVLVMTKHSDPRTGDTTYRLTNVQLAEPPQSLFQVPADYTLKDSVIRRQSPLKQQ